MGLRLCGGAVVASLGSSQAAVAKYRCRAVVAGHRKPGLGARALTGTRPRGDGCHLRRRAAQQQGVQRCRFGLGLGSTCTGLPRDAHSPAATLSDCVCQHCRAAVGLSASLPGGPRHGARANLLGIRSSRPQGAFCLRCSCGKSLADWMGVAGAPRPRDHRLEPRGRGCGTGARDGWHCCGGGALCSCLRLPGLDELVLGDGLF
mmetsp:Transcript_132612/g.424364  ORF Transcript_132612/g.424364 Transcript_132612/m.424364 type:complete len:204 (-) Transcript_132612:1071-1682(-)